LVLVTTTMVTVIVAETVTHADQRIPSDESL